MTCIYTGAKVYMPDYSIAAPADIYRVRDVLIIKFNPSCFDGPFIDRPEDTTHIVLCNPPGAIEVFKSEGMIVAPHNYVIKTAKAQNRGD